MELAFEYGLILIGVAFFSTLVLTKFSIIKLSKYGIVAKDLHKKGFRKIPRVGGIAIASGFTIGVLILFMLTNSFLHLLILLAFLLASLVGLMDDFAGFGIVQKLITPCLAALPLLLLVPWELIPIIIVFLGASVLSNWTNMLAGFNGLEAGMGCIVLFFLALFLPPNFMLIFFMYSASLLAFLFFNRYPAKIFPGNVGTTPQGIMILVAFLLGVPWYVLAILLIPYFLDACLKFFSAGFMSRYEHNPTKVSGEGYLLEPEKRSYISLSRLILKVKPLREWQLVVLIWVIEIILGIMALVMI